MSMLNEMPLTRAIAAIFSEEIEQAGGAVSDRFDDGQRLFLRSTLPAIQEVRPRDRVQGGVALRATETDVWVHPYVFRQVCSNGAILAHAIQTRHIELGVIPDADEDAIREAVRLCAAPEAFAQGAGEMRAAVVHDQTDALLNLMPLLTRSQSSINAQVLQTILARFFESRDNSRFGLMNAITSVARDTRDPEVRWRLEELGGAVPVAHPDPDRPHTMTARAVAYA